MTAPRSLAVLFSAPPDPVTGAAAGSYCIAGGSSTSCTPPGSPALTAASPSGTGTLLTLAADAAPGASYRLFATGVTRASDGLAVSTGSVPFAGYTVLPFSVVAASSTGETEVTVAFSDPPAGPLTAANFCVALASAADCSASALAVSAVAPSPWSGSQVTLTTAPQAKGQAYRLTATGATRASDGQPLGAASAPFGGQLLSNGSFEVDGSPASSNATSAPAGWAMLSSAAAGKLLHAEPGGQGGVPAAAEGQNVATFDLPITTSYSGREARSDCFPVAPAKATTVRGALFLPSAQAPAATRASFKLWYFTDAACTAASAIRPFDTQDAASNKAAGIWELRTWQPAATPSDAAFGALSIRAGAASTSSTSDRLFFDALSVAQP
jgi:hypothetical protein